MHSKQVEQITGLDIPGRSESVEFFLGSSKKLHPITIITEIITISLSIIIVDFLQRAEEEAAPCISPSAQLEVHMNNVTKGEVLGVAMVTKLRI